MVVLKCILGLVIGAVVPAFFSGFTWPILAIFMGGKGADKALESAQWWIIPIGGLIGLLIPLLHEAGEKAARDEEERKQRMAREAQAKQEQDRAAAELERQKQQLERQKQQLASLLSASQHDFLTIPELVPSSDAHLDRAEKEFADGAFDPFWDEIEQATNKLAAYNDAVRRISRNAQDYDRDSAKLPVQMPKFSLPEGRLPDARPIAERLSKIVRVAQKNIDFTTVYNQRAQINEQRKTNRLLYAGFSTLRDAISSLGSAISSSLRDLSDSVHSSLDDILQATRDQTDAMESIAERQEQAERDRQDEQSRRDERRDASDAKYKDEHLTKEQAQTEILNSMWRKKKPPFRDPHPRDPHP